MKLYLMAWKIPSFNKCNSKIFLSLCIVISAWKSYQSGGWKMFKNLSFLSSKAWHSSSLVQFILPSFCSSPCLFLIVFLFQLCEDYASLIFVSVDSVMTHGFFPRDSISFFDPLFKDDSQTPPLRRLILAALANSGQYS